MPEGIKAIRIQSISILDNRGRSYEESQLSGRRRVYALAAIAGALIAAFPTSSPAATDPLAGWHVRNSGVTNILNAAAYDAGTFVAAGGRAWVSADGVPWPQNSPGSGGVLSDIAYGNGKFVGVGDVGSIVTSADGVNWTRPSSGTATLLYNIAYGGGAFTVVGGPPGVILTSTDGLQWKPRSIGTGAKLFNVAYAGSTFVAVGDAGTIIQSDPLVTPPRLDVSLSGGRLHFRLAVGRWQFPALSN